MDKQYAELRYFQKKLKDIRARSDFKKKQNVFKNILLPQIFPIDMKIAVLTTPPKVFWHRANNKHETFSFKLQNKKHKLSKRLFILKNP